MRSGNKLLRNAEFCILGQFLAPCLLPRLEAKIVESGEQALSGLPVK